MNYFKELGMFNFVTSNNPDERMIGAMIYDNEEDYTDYDDENYDIEEYFDNEEIEECADLNVDI